MEKITTVDSLQQRILFLEQRCAAEEIILKDHFRKAQESLKPSRLIVSTIKDLTSSSELRSGILDMALGWGAGSISKRLVTGASGGFIKQIVGSIAETLVTVGVSKNAEGIKSAIAGIVQKFSGKDKPEANQENNL